MKYIKSLFSIALTSLVMIPDTSAKSNSSWSWPRCKAQCTKQSCSKEARLVDCATNCKVPTIKSCIDSNIKTCSKFNPGNKLSLEKALESSKDELLKSVAIVGAKRQRPDSFNVTKKMDAIKKEQWELNAQIDYVRGLLITCRGYAEKPTAPKGSQTPTGIPAPSHSEPPSDLPPPFPGVLPQTTTPRASKPLPSVPQRRASTSQMELPRQDHPNNLPVSDLPANLEEANKASSASAGKSGGTPSHLAALGDNPMARLRKVPEEQKNDRSGVVQEKSGGSVPSHLADLGDNPKARLRKVPEEQKNDRSDPMAKSSPSAANDLYDALKKRRLSIGPEEETQNSHNNFEQEWDD